MQVSLGNAKSLGKRAKISIGKIRFRVILTAFLIWTNFFFFFFVGFFLNSRENKEITEHFKVFLFIKE